jgi:uncharacterized protein YciI
MLFLVLLTEKPEFNDLRRALRHDRQAYLDSIAHSGRLLAEGTFMDGGSLMVIDAPSPGDAIALLQGDPYVVQPVSNRVQIRPLLLNFVAPAIASQDGGLPDTTAHKRPEP